MAARDTLEALEAAAAASVRRQRAGGKHRVGKIHFPDNSLIHKTV